MDWRETRALKAEGHKLLDDIVLLKGKMGGKRAKNHREKTYRLIGAHFSQLSGEKLLEALDLLRRQKFALEESLKIPAPKLVRSPTPLPTNRL